MLNLRSMGAAMVAAVGLLVAGGAATAQVVQPAPLEAYGALPSFEMARLSPEGGRLAFITVNGEARTLVLLDLATRQQVGGADVGTAKVRDLEWLDETRVLITTSKTENIPQLGISQAELFSAQIYDPTTNRIVQVLKDTRDVFPILFSEPFVTSGPDPKVLVRAFAFTYPERMDMWDVDTRTGRAGLFEVMGQTVGDYVLGPDGQSVARAEYEPRFQTWSLHLRRGGGFAKAWEVSAPIDRPSLVGLGLNGDSVIVVADRPDLLEPGREAPQYWDVNLATGAWKPVRFGFRTSGLLFHPVTRRLMGARRIEDGAVTYAFVDPAGTALWQNVAAAFAGKSPAIESWSDDMRQAVVSTWGPGDSGTFYVVDLDAGGIIKAGQSYAGIAPEQVAPIRPISYDAADGLRIHGYLTTPPGVEDPKGLPLVVLAHGGPAARDFLTFDWWGQALASRGYAVLQANFRGSTGYGDDFMEAGYGEWGRKMQTDLSDGVRYLAAEGIVDPERVCIVGASYGGYAALAGVTIDRGVYRCAVSVAGVSDLRAMLDERSGADVRRGNANTRYWARFMGGDGIGDRSLDQRSPAFLAAQADAPILLIHGRDDVVVPIDQSRRMQRALDRADKPYEFVELSGEDHWLSRGETRLRMLTETLRFLQQHNPAN